MKKGLVAALSGLCILSMSLGIVACTSPNTDSGSDVPVSITTLTPEFEYHVGDNVHMFDHFSYVDGLTYTFTVQYEDEEAVTVEGDAYYLAEAGNYKITCEASNGKESKKESVTITVGNEKAFIQFKNREAQVDWKKIMWDTDIIALADPITIVDCEYETYIESVVIYDAADGSGRTVVIEDGVKIEDDAGVFYNGNDKFTFVYECDYVFTIVCETSGGKVSDKLTVSAKENFDSLQVLSDYSASYNADTFTANWDAVTGASSYYVKVDRKQMVTEETTVNIESLIVSDFQYFDLYIVPLDSEGNRLGKIICEDIVIAPEGAEGIVKGPGASIDVAAKEATLVGYQAASAGYESGIRHVKNSYIAYGYKYGVGTYVDFTFTGNNMPQVCFFANEVNGNMTCHSGSVHQSTPNEGYLFMNGLNVTGDVKGKDSFICVGPYRFGCKDHGNHINYTEITEGSTKRFIISKNSLFTYNGLEAAGSDKEYIYTVGSFTSGGCLAFELILRDADTQEVLETARIVTAQSAATVKAGHIIAYAGVKGNGTQTTFGYGEPYQGTPLPVYEQGVTYNEDGSVTLDGKASPGSYVYHVAQVDNSYVSIQGEYGLDTYIDINFKGNNMPQVLLFADQINGNMTSMGGKGVLFSNGLVTANPAGSILRKYSIYGPNRIYLYGGLSDTDKVVKDTNTYEGSDSRVINNSYWTLLGYDSSGNVSDYPFLTQKGLATTPDTEYKYTLGMYEKDGIVYAHIELYDVTNDIEVYNFNQATTLSASDLTAGNIILYGSVAGTANTTTFSYSEPYTKTQEEPEDPDEPTIPENVEASGATFNDNGSVTLEGKAAPGSYVYHIAQLNNSYVALKGTYGLDTYIDITFTGNNMPQVMFFADQINGNMTSMGGKGVLFSNGLATANPAGSILRKYAIYGPNRIYLYGGITDSDKVVQNTNTYEGSDSRVINNANRILLGYDASGNVSDYPYLTQQGLATTPDVEYKYTLGFYEKDGVIYAHIELYDVTNDVEVYNFDQATTLSASDLTAGNIILYGSVAGTANTTTFSYSEPYTKTQEEPEDPEDPVIPEEPTLPENVEASGATFNDNGSVTLEGKVTPGGYVYHIAQIDNSYVALKGEYGLDTYIDITFVGNNMPQVLFFADQINGNMTSMGGKGVLFSHGIANAGMNQDFLRKYYIFGPNRITLHGGITDADKQVIAANWYETSDSRVINNANKLLIGYDSSGNASDYAFLTQKGLATTPDVEYKYTLGFYEKDGVIYAHIELYDVTNDVEVYNFDQATTLSASDLTAGSIILYGSVAGTANTTTFSYSEPYTKTQEEPEDPEDPVIPEEPTLPENVEASGATFNDDGSVTLEGKAAPGNYVYHVAQVDNSYVALKGTYGLNTYIDITFKGNNMPQVLFFADQINGNMTSMGGKGVLFSNGLVTANPAGSILRKYAIYGPNRIYLYGGITDSDKVVQNTNTYEGSDSRVISNTNKVLLGYDASGNVSDYPFLTQKGLATTPDTVYKYTLGFYEKDGVIYAHIELYDVTNDVEVYNFDQATTLSASDLTAGNIILYGSVAGTANMTTFSYSEPYTKTQEEPEDPEDPVIPEEPTLPENVEASGATFNDDGSVTLEGKVTPGGYVYHIAQIDNSYVALKGEYGLDTYIDITFVGNNMPQVLFFADQINGNMTSIGGKGVLFSHGIANASMNQDFLRKYYIFGPNRITLHGGITDADKQVIAANWYETSDSRVINNANKLLIGYDSSGNASDYAFLTQKGLATTPDVEYKYTLGLYEKDGVIYARIELYDVTNDVEVYNFDQATTLSASDLTAGNIILYGSVAGTANTTTFSYSEPYTKTQEEPEVPEEEIRPANSGATFNDDGSVTLEAKAAPGSYVYHVAQMDNSYVAIEGEYGLGTYIDITFKGNNMPQVMFFADQINGNLTSMGGKGVLFSNGLSTANPAGSILRKYAIYGPNRIYLYGGITDSDKVVQNTNTYEGSDSRVISNTNKVLLGYDASGNVSDYPYLTQKGLATTPDTEYRYTLGMYEKDGVVYAHIELYNLTNDVEVYNFDQATTLSTSDLTAGSIILYGSVAGTANTTTFSYSKPYTKEQA